jgi:hypothetical protein
MAYAYEATEKAYFSSRQRDRIQYHTISTTTLACTLVVLVISLAPPRPPRDSPTFGGTIVTDRKVIPRLSGGDVAETCLNLLSSLDRDTEMIRAEVTAEVLTRDGDATVATDEDSVFGQVDDRVAQFHGGVRQG